MNINKLNIILFDTSLRDGLQCLSTEKHYLYTTKYKKKIFDNIVSIHNPKYIEIGSLVNSTIIPIMKDTIELFKNINNNNNNIFILIPNKNYLLKAIVNNIKNYSFITSLSNSFQLKNIKKNINQMKNELYEMMNIINNLKKYNNSIYYTKLYISCINECPIEGKIDNDYIIKDIIYYYENFNIDILCLCDTCGSLTFLDYKYIIDNLIKNNISFDRFSLHLHIDIKNIDNIENIIFYSLDNNIKHFDISLLEFGGCSVTIKNDHLNNNLSYELSGSIE